MPNETFGSPVFMLGSENSVFNLVYVNNLSELELKSNILAEGSKRDYHIQDKGDRMTTFTEKARSYYDALKPVDKDRIQPIVELFESCAESASIDYYHPNILYFYVKGKLALGLAPRKSYISFYVGSYQTLEIFREALPRLGKSDNGVGCIRFKKLADIDMGELKAVFTRIAESEHSGGGSLLEQS